MYAAFYILFYKTDVILKLNSSKNYSQRVFIGHYRPIYLNFAVGAAGFANTLAGLHIYFRNIFSRNIFSTAKCRICQRDIL